MKHVAVGGAMLAIALLCGYAIGADAPKSGPQVGDKLVPFNVLNSCNPAFPKKVDGKFCLV